MTTTIDGIAYPNTLVEISRNKTFCYEFLLSFKGKKEIYNMLRFVLFPEKPTDIYFYYLSKSAKYKFKLPTPIMKAVETYAPTKDFGSSGWADVVSQIHRHARAQVQQKKVIEEFFSSRAFQKMHQKETKAEDQKLVKKFGNPTMVAVRAGIKYAPEVDEIIILLVKKQKNEAVAKAKVLLRKQGVKAKPEDLIKAFQSGKSLKELA
ncbi:hypothetical protein SAMN05444272_1228 [Roseibium suaedae]|uniref:Uncharacterized protein n=2 Tax=Roseibium suaedae TaxID=735517 RepID=A0A1M7CPA9_9HYPH|nr:hypothetical protein SAMN05444272_1228 [Roseibium suaedae]